MKKYFYLFVFTFFVLGSFLVTSVTNAITDNIAQLVFITSEQTILTDTVSAVLTIETQNSSGVLEPLDTSGTVLELSSSSPTGEFSSNAVNWIPVSTLGMNNTWAHRNFYYKDSTTGAHTLTISAQGKSWTPATQTITINALTTTDITPPSLYLPPDIAEEATGPDGAIVNYVTTADDTDPIHPEVICVPASGSTFPIGTTVVNCSATDTAGNIATGSFNITVNDFVEIASPPNPPRRQSSGSWIVRPNVLNVPNTELIKKILDSEKGQVLGTEKFNFTKDLFFGVRSEEVKELQKFLISQGLLKKGAFGGFFGIFTETALKEYQKANNLWVDGIVGPQTRAMLNK